MGYTRVPCCQPGALMTHGALLAASEHANSQRRASAGRAGTAQATTGRCTDFPECVGNAQGSFAVGFTKQVPSLLYAIVVHCMRGIFVVTSPVNISASCSLDSSGVWGWSLVIICNPGSSWKFSRFEYLARYFQMESVIKTYAPVLSVFLLENLLYFIA